MNKAGAILCFFILLLSGCGGKDNEFVVEGTINNLGGRPLYAVYGLENGIVVDTLRPQNGFISFKNSSSTLIPIQFYYFDKTPFTRIYVQNGDRIELSGDGQDPFGLKVKGSSLNKELFKFNHEHKELLQTWLTERNASALGRRSQRYEQLNEELRGVIAAYVGKHKDSPVSVVLLDNYLIGEAEEVYCDSLIQLLNPSLLSEPWAVSVAEYGRGQIEQQNDTVLPYFSLYALADTTVLLSTQDAKATLLCFWSAETPGTDKFDRFLQEMAERYDTLGLQVVSISLDRDSAVWRQRAESDSTRWEQRWLKNGYLYAGVKDLHIHSLPHLLVADSTGKIVARGVLPDSLSVAIERLVKP